MSLLLIAPIHEAPAASSFGTALAEHLSVKTNAAVRSASLTAWSLLAQGMMRLGMSELPEVHFEPNGKPAFIGCPLHFSLSHSGNLACALISDAPCGVDIERIRPATAQKLRARCLSEGEAALDFFECWTKKECIVKLDGSGIPADPRTIDVLDEKWAGQFHVRRIEDSFGQAYMLSALCRDAEHLSVTIL